MGLEDWMQFPFWKTTVRTQTAMPPDATEGLYVSPQQPSRTNILQDVPTTNSSHV